MPDSDTVADIVALLPRLRRFALGLSGNRDDADELVQAACERTLSRLEQWQPGTRLDSWMYRITQNLWFSELRRRRSRGDPVAPTALDAVAHHDGQRDNDTQLALRQVLRDIETLPDDQRVVLLLVAVEGLAYREVAEILSIPIGTVMSRLSRARQRLVDATQGPVAARTTEVVKQT